MKLSAEMLAEVTESVTIVGREEPRPADRRSPRVQLSSHLFAFDWADPSKPFGIRVRNLSDGGVGILHHERIALDEKLVVRFPRKADPRGNEQHLLLLGTVVYWEPLAENLYAVGVQFDRVVHPSEMVEKSTPQVEQGNVFSRFTQAMARTWRAAS